MLVNRQLKILVVEDNNVDREIYKECLREIANMSFEFAEAGSAAEGIELARTFRPDCTLLDYDLPDGNGLEVLARFNQEGPPGAVVMLTAFGGEDLAVRAMKAGVTDYLPKRHVRAESLAVTVTNAVQKFEMERKIGEHRDALARSEQRYANLLEAIPQMVWTSDSEGLVQYANGLWLEYTGLTVENAGRLGWDAVLHREDHERTWEAWQAATESASTFEIEHRLRRASDGTYRWHLVRAVPMMSQGGEVASWFGTCTDVENQKRTEKALMEMEKLETLGMLAGGIAHDFNNLLVGILGGASLVLDSLPEAHPSRDILNEVVHAGEQAADLTRKMLAYSGRGNFFVENVDLDQLARETCRFLRHSVPAAIGLQFQSGGSLPRVATDIQQLRHLIVELVMNAVEAIGKKTPGTILVRSALAEDPPNGGPCVVLEVEDSGCGMDETTQAKIFDPFFSTKFTGRGLGLSAVKGFVRSSGGEIRVHSVPGEGAHFQVILPAVVEERSQSASGAEY